MKVWITKYALTKGITEEEAEVAGIGEGRMIVVSKGNWKTYYHKPDWHETPRAAVARAEQMRAGKIVSLEKKIAKLEKMSFDGGGK